MEQYKQEIITLLKANRKIEAIKVYRDHTGASLKESKNAIDLAMFSTDLEEAVLNLPESYSSSEYSNSTNVQREIHRSSMNPEPETNSSKKYLLFVAIIVVLLFFCYLTFFK